MWVSTSGKPEKEPLRTVSHIYGLCSGHSFDFLRCTSWAEMPGFCLNGSKCLPFVLELSPMLVQESGVYKLLGFLLFPPQHPGWVVCQWWALSLQSMELTGKTGCLLRRNRTVSEASHHCHNGLSIGEPLERDGSRGSDCSMQRCASGAAHRIINVLWWAFIVSL